MYGPALAAQPLPCLEHRFRSAASLFGIYSVVHLGTGEFREVLLALSGVLLLPISPHPDLTWIQGRIEVGRSRVDFRWELTARRALFLHKSLMSTKV